jgi:Mg-chelatase subunit ChlD
MPPTTPSATAKKTAAKKTTPAPSKRGAMNGAMVRHGKVHDITWDAAEAKAVSEGRGLWEVIRQLLAEYARGDHDKCTPNQ